MMVIIIPFDLVCLGWLDLLLDHCWGQLGSILGHLVAPQNYGGSLIELDHVLGVQKLI